MSSKIEIFIQPHLKKDLPDVRSGDTVKVYQKIKEKDKQRIQVFEGLVLARKHGKGINSTITVRKVISGIGVEKIFPVHSPVIEKIEIIRRGKTRRAKLYYLREAKGKKARLKRKEFEATAPAEEKTKKLEKTKESEEIVDKRKKTENSELKKEEKPKQEKSEKENA